TLPENTIAIHDTDKCHRYAGILVRNVKVQESPSWLQQLLLSIGLRPLNNVVDITNFVLHELGQPLHAFDYYQLDGGKIIVRSFDKSTPFTTLDEAKREVPAGSLFICDENKPIALAGIMGGLNSEISESTKDILIESAWFEPAGIRKSSKKLALQTDSSYRFERGVDPEITLNAALRCAELVLELCGGDIEGMADIHPVKPISKEIQLRHSRLNQMLGVSLESKTATDILNKLEFELTESGEGWTCTVPSFRPDIHGEIDLIEEVARIYDYNNIPDPESINITSPEPVPFRESFTEHVRQAAIACGLTEIYTNSLLPENLLEMLGGPENVVATLNPITKDQALLRPDLLYGFLRSAAYNFNRKTSGVAFFEIGNIFRKEPGGGTWIKDIHESTHLLIGIAGQNHEEHWKATPRSYDLFDLKAFVTVLLKKLDVEQDISWSLSDDRLVLSVRQQRPSKKSLGEGAVLGWLTEVDSEWKKKTDLDVPAFYGELDLHRLQQLAEKRKKKTYVPLSKFPPFEFDLALVVDGEVLAGDIKESMFQIAGKSLNSVEIFDVFEGKSLGEGKKSIAFRLLF
ncbi:phenylalanine--tRNA ligase subunit beta, partial [Balneolaceae bacterium ANBcel3]|nr:phenylalanine--tRNA ligase subunit beta [Balneolaceae bacterium ANBcel3]